MSVSGVGSSDSLTAFYQPQIDASEALIKALAALRLESANFHIGVLTCAVKELLAQHPKSTELNQLLTDLRAFPKDWDLLGAQLNRVSSLIDCVFPAVPEDAGLVTVSGADRNRVIQALSTLPPSLQAFCAKITSMHARIAARHIAPTSNKELHKFYSSARILNLMFHGVRLMLQPRQATPTDYLCVLRTAS